MIAYPLKEFLNHSLRYIFSRVNFYICVETEVVKNSLALASCSVESAKVENHTL